MPSSSTCSTVAECHIYAIFLRSYARLLLASLPNSLLTNYLALFTTLLDLPIERLVSSISFSVSYILNSTTKSCAAGSYAMANNRTQGLYHNTTSFSSGHRYATRSSTLPSPTSTTGAYFRNQIIDARRLDRQDRVLEAIGMLMDLAYWLQQKVGRVDDGRDVFEFVRRLWARGNGEDVDCSTDDKMEGVKMEGTKDDMLPIQGWICKS